jgi:hypothetical protein
MREFILSCEKSRAKKLAGFSVSCCMAPVCKGGSFHRGIVCAESLAVKNRIYRISAAKLALRGHLPHVDFNNRPDFWRFDFQILSGISLTV